MTKSKIENLKLEQQLLTELPLIDTTSSQPFINTLVSGSLPDDWKPRPVDIKSGWKSNANTLQKIVTEINNEIYIEDESAEMEKIDIVLQWIKARYNITVRQ